MTCVYDKMNMKEFDGNWNFDRSKFIVCSRHYLDPLMFMTRKEWSMRNVVLRENKEAEWIEIFLGRKMSEEQKEKIRQLVESIRQALLNKNKPV